MAAIGHLVLLGKLTGQQPENNTGLSHQHAILGEKCLEQETELHQPECEFSYTEISVENKTRSSVGGHLWSFRALGIAAENQPRQTPPTQRDAYPANSSAAGGPGASEEPLELGRIIFLTLNRVDQDSTHLDLLGLAFDGVGDIPGQTPSLPNETTRL